MRLGTNISSLTSIVNLNETSRTQTTALRRLSSGRKLNSSADNAAGYAISKKMALQIQGLKTASKNVLDGVSLIQTADGAMNQIHDMLQRMRELAVKAANGTNQLEDKEAIQKEIDQLTSEVNKMRETTEFNKNKIFKNIDEDGNYKPTMNLDLQSGANENQLMGIPLEEISAFNLGISGKKGTDGSDRTNNPNAINNSKLKFTKKSGLTDFYNPKDIDTTVTPNEANEAAIDVTDQESAGLAISAYDAAIAKVSEIRSQLGAVQNRFEKTIATLDSTNENITQAMSRIEDADLAEEMTEFTKFNILQQAGTSMLAQANQIPQSVLKLLDN